MKLTTKLLNHKELISSTGHSLIKATVLRTASGVMLFSVFQLRVNVQYSQFGVVQFILYSPVHSVKSSPCCPVQ